MSFLGINLASRALQAVQRELEVTGQNIANASTAGYSRQIAVTRSVEGAGSTGGDGRAQGTAPGGGVDVAQVLRSHAAWLDRATEGLTAQSGQNGVEEQYSAQVESLLSEPTDYGLQATLGRMFSAFSNLAANPNDLALRNAAILAGQDVGTRFRHLTEGIDTLKPSIITQAGQNIDTVNSLAKQIAELNGVIGQAQAAGTAPNELLDQRDQLLDNLTRITGASVSGRDGSQLVVSIGGITLIQGDTAEQLTLDTTSGFSLETVGSGIQVQLMGGELKSQQDWIETKIPAYLQQFQGIRDQLATQINQIHQSGNDLNGSPGLAFFTADIAGNISVNSAIAADPKLVVSGDGSPGDGTLAQAISDLQSGASSVVPAYQSLVANIGSASSNAKSANAQSQASLEQVQGMQSSESGVNLDEELARMVSLQHTYAANAKLLTVYDNMLSTLIDQVS